MAGTEEVTREFHVSGLLSETENKADSNTDFKRLSTGIECSFEQIMTGHGRSSRQRFGAETLKRYKNPVENLQIPIENL